MMSPRAFPRFAVGSGSFVRPPRIGGPRVRVVRSPGPPRQPGLRREDIYRVVDIIAAGFEGFFKVRIIRSRSVEILAPSK